MIKKALAVAAACLAGMALAGGAALSARAGAAPPSSSTEVGVVPDGSAWVVVGNSIEYCYLNQSSRPVCEAVRRYP